MVSFAYFFSWSLWKRFLTVTWKRVTTVVEMSKSIWLLFGGVALKLSKLINRSVQRPGQWALYAGLSKTKKTQCLPTRIRPILAFLAVVRVPGVQLLLRFVEHCAAGYYAIGRHFNTYCRPSLPKTWRVILNGSQLTDSSACNKEVIASSNLVNRTRRMRLSVRVIV